MTWPAAVLAASPAVLYELDETSGTTVTDSSGHGINATYQWAPTLGNASLIPGNTSGKSVGITSANQFIEMNYTGVNVNPTVGGAVMLTYKGAGVAQDGGAAILFRCATGSDFYIRIDTTNVVVNFFYAAIDTGWPSSNLKDGNPHLIILHWTPTMAFLVVDGVTRWSYAHTQTIGSGNYWGFCRNGANGGSTVYGSYDSIAIFTSPLTSTLPIYNEWLAAGSVEAYPVEALATVGFSTASYVQVITVPGVDEAATVGQAWSAYAITPKSVARVEHVPGPAGDGVTVVRFGSVPRTEHVPGPAAIESNLTQPAVCFMSVERIEHVPGPRVLDPAPTDPTIPTVLVAGYPVDARFVADGYPTLDASAHLPMNTLFTGSFRTPQRGPAADAGIGLRVAGSRIMTGRVSSKTVAEVASNEEAGQLVDVEVEGTLGGFRRIKVLPDFGAQDTSRLGSPSQDVRVFDWTMNGSFGSYFGDQAPTIIPSSSLDAVEADERLIFAMPDVWCDADARWMWVSDPSKPAPVGWCHFVVPTPIGTSVRTQWWAAASHYAEVWVDGVLLLTCDKPSEAQHIEMDATKHFHRVSIKAWAGGGPAGVMFSMVPIGGDGMFQAPTMNSRSGWKSVAYPANEKYTFIESPGQVMNRLREEAAMRGVAEIAGWSFTFGNHTDSAGKPWDRKQPIELDVGMDYLEVLERLAEDRIDFREGPGGHRLDMWQKGSGSGHAVSIPWAAAVNLDTRAVEERVP